VEIKTILTILHILGVAIGAGGAFSADYIFFQCIKDKRISVKEMGFIENSSKMIWLGLFILFVSGIGLFLLDPIKYSESSKFITKMIIVLIIAVNGVIFHRSHIPILKKSVGSYLTTHKEFLKNKSLFILSGVVSIVSWLGALVLGSLRSISYSVGEALVIYFLIIFVGFIVSKIIMRKYL
jgi:hypothetical protein